MTRRMRARAATCCLAVVLLAIAVVIGGCAPASRHETARVGAPPRPLTLRFAGFAYAGEFQSLDARFPYTRKLNQLSFDSELRTRLQGVKRRDVTITVGDLGQLRQ